MIDYYDQIDDYVNGLLQGEELVAFEAAIGADSELASAVENHDVAMGVIGSLIEEEVRGVIKEEDDEEENLSNISDQKDNYPKALHGNVRWIKVIRYVAAACVVGIVGYWGLSNLNNEIQVQFTEVYSEPGWPSQRGDETNELTEIFVQYFGGNKNRAKSDLRSIKLEDASLWLAEIYLQEEKFDSVLMYVPTATTNDRLKRDRINYLKILSLYYLNKHDEATIIFNSLPQDTDKFYFDLYSKLSLSEKAKTNK